MIASSLSYPSRPHRRRRRSFYLPCPLYVDSLLESYSTINIFASDNNHLWIYRKKLSVFLGSKGLNDVENYELPRLVYVLVRREPRSDHHKKVEEINLLYSVEDMTLWGSIKWS
ncbi:unnamed protein product [Brassica oleracea var. botrytis]